jgi:hypothetical protein
MSKLKVVRLYELQRSRSQRASAISSPLVGAGRNDFARRRDDAAAADLVDAFAPPRGRKQPVRRYASEQQFR